MASLQLICASHPGGGAEACFTLNIAADVSPAYVQKPPAIAIKNPIAPRSSHYAATSAEPVLATRRTALAVTVQMTYPKPWVAKYMFLSSPNTSISSPAATHHFSHLY